MSEQNFTYLIGTTPDGRVLIDFRGRPIDHLVLTETDALELAEGIMQAVKDARQGIILPTSGFPIRG